MTDVNIGELQCTVLAVAEFIIIFSPNFHNVTSTIYTTRRSPPPQGPSTWSRVRTQRWIWCVATVNEVITSYEKCSLLPYRIHKHESVLYINSNDSFVCERNKYVLICNKQWIRVQHRLNSFEVEGGSADFLPIFIGVAVCIVLIAALIIYILRLRKKMGIQERETNNERSINLVSNEPS